METILCIAIRENQEEKPHESVTTRRVEINQLLGYDHRYQTRIRD